MNKLTIFIFLVSLSIALLSKAQSIKDYIDNNTQDTRYTLNGDGTSTDKQTELMWMRCSLGQTWDSVNKSCTRSAMSYNWQQALDIADSYRFSGFSDWRLPNIVELQSLVAYDRFSPSINLTIFPDTTNSVYWSSSPRAYIGAGPWGVWFASGTGIGIHYSSLDVYVRLVRDATEPTDEVEQPETINIVDTWSYILTYDACPNLSEEGTSTWAYHSDGYSLSTYTSNQIDPRSCSYIGSDDSDDAGNHYPASNPITSEEFESGLNNYDSNYSWYNTQFESKNRISLMGTVINTYSATIIFTR